MAFITPDLSTGRLLTMTWLDGQPLLSFKQNSLDDRNQIARAMFRAWWYPFSHHGVIHGDPHLGNYTVFSDDGRPAGINLLDYGCIRSFPPRFVQGVVNLYQGLLAADRDRVVAAYEEWGFRGLTDELIDGLDSWTCDPGNPVASLAAGESTTFELLMDTATAGDFTATVRIPKREGNTI